jgi:hypothetical protein
MPIHMKIVGRKSMILLTSETYAFIDAVTAEKGALLANP